jgi:hypothetical protein
MLAKRVSSDKHWLESDSRQAPEHYKTPYFSKQILYMCYMYCCITYKSWLETLAALYHSLSRDMNPWILHRPRSNRCLVLLYAVEVRWFPDTCELYGYLYMAWLAIFSIVERNHVLIKRNKTERDDDSEAIRHGGLGCGSIPIWVI